MVLEPFAALSLAGNVCQFVDLSCKLFGTSSKIYISTSGLQASTEDLEAVTLDLQEFCSNLKWSSDRPAKSKEEQDLKSLAEKCEKEAGELLSVLNRLRAKNPKSKWNCFRSALRTIWSQEEINSMQKRLDSYRSELILRLQALDKSV